MSLSVYLKQDRTDFLIAADLCEENGFAEVGKFLRQVATTEEASYHYSANITHNLNSMAEAAGIYKALWRPEEIQVSKASQLIPLLTEGLEKLRASPDEFRKFNPKNGWGIYEGLCNFVETYLAACQEFPEALVSVSR